MFVLIIFLIVMCAVGAFVYVVGVFVGLVVEDVGITTGRIVPSDKQGEPESYFVKRRETPRQFWQNWQSGSLGLAAFLAIAFSVISIASVLER